MPIEKQIKARLQQKHDIEANWRKAVNFVPKEGEIIVYDAEDASTDLTDTGRANPITYSRTKIGDGVTKVNELPFASDNSLLMVKLLPGDPESESEYDISYTFDDIYKAYQQKKVILLVDIKGNIYSCKTVEFYESEDHQEGHAYFCGYISKVGFVYEDHPALVEQWIDITNTNFVRFEDAYNFIIPSDVTISQMISEKTPLIIKIEENALDNEDGYIECEYSSQELYERILEGQTVLISYNKNLYNCISYEEDFIYFLCLEPTMTTISTETETYIEDYPTFSTNLLELNRNELSNSNYVYDWSLVTDYALTESLAAISNRITTLGVTIIGEEGDLSSSLNYPYQEIRGAIENGQTVIVNYNNKTYSLYEISDSEITFTANVVAGSVEDSENDNGQRFVIPQIIFTNDGEIQYFESSNLFDSIPSEGHVNYMISQALNNLPEQEHPIFVVNSYIDPDYDEYIPLATHSPEEINQAHEEGKIVYLLYDGLTFEYDGLYDGYVYFSAIGAEHYIRNLNIGVYGGMEENYYQISEDEIGAHGRYLTNFDVFKDNEEPIWIDELVEKEIYKREDAESEESQAIRNVPTFQEVEDLIANEVGNAEEQTRGIVTQTLIDHDFLAEDEHFINEYTRNVPTYEEMQESIDAITPDYIGAAYADPVYVELTEEYDENDNVVLYANFPSSLIMDLIDYNNCVYLIINETGEYIPCISASYEFVKFYDINTNTIYTIDDNGLVTIEEDNQIVKPLIVTTENNISNYSSQEILEAAQAGRTVYLKMQSGTYLKLSWVNGTEATFDYPGTQTIVSSDGGSHNTHTFRTVVIQNNDVFYKSIPMASQNYVDAQIGNIESVLDNIITLQTSLIGGNE